MILSVVYGERRSPAKRFYKSGVEGAEIDEGVGGQVEVGHQVGDRVQVGCNLSHFLRFEEIPILTSCDFYR